MRILGNTGLHRQTILPYLTQCDTFAKRYIMAEKKENHLNKQSNLSTDLESKLLNLVNHHIREIQSWRVWRERDVAIMLLQRNQGIVASFPPRHLQFNKFY